MTILADTGIQEEVRNINDITNQVCKLTTKSWRNPILEMKYLGLLISRNLVELSIFTKNLSFHRTTFKISRKVGM